MIDPDRTKFSHLLLACVTATFAGAVVVHAIFPTGPDSSPQMSALSSVLLAMAFIFPIVAVVAIPAYLVARHFRKLNIYVMTAVALAVTLGATALAEPRTWEGATAGAGFFLFFALIFSTVTYVVLRVLSNLKRD